MSDCCWKMDSLCAGSVSERKLFQNQIRVPACDAHYNEHLKIVLYAELGNVEEALMKTPGERDSELNAMLTAKGLDLTKELKRLDEQEQSGLAQADGTP